MTRKHYKKPQCNSLFSQYPFFPCPLFCIVFSWLGMGEGSRKHRIHLSSRLTLSVEFVLRFHVGPVRRTTVYASTTQSQSFILLLVLQSVLLKFFYMFVHSSIFKKRSTSSTKFLLSSFHCFVKPSFYLLLSTGVSHRSSSHKFNFCCHASSLPFCNHTSRMRN